MLKAKEDLLVIAAQNGNDQAFAFLCKHYHVSLHRFAYKLSNDHQLAQDAVQNAWIKITKKLKDIEDPRAFKSWVFRAVRWCAYDLMRKSQRQEELVEQEMLDSVASPQNVEDDNAENLHTLIALLPEIDKQAIYLFYLEEMKIVEIADILQIASGTVKSRLNRARNMLRKLADEKLISSEQIVPEESK